MPDSDPVAAADRRRRSIILAAAVAFPLVLILLGSTSRPWLGYVVIALVLGAAAVAGLVHNRRTREGTDERALANHRWATSITFYVTGFALLGTQIWMSVRHGVRAAEPYTFLLGLHLATYVSTSLWRRWRGV